MTVEKQKFEEASTSRFYKFILSWDYFRLLKDSTQVKNKKKKASLGFREVKDTYKDVEDYIATFEPLLFEEVKAQISQKKDDDEVTEWNMRLIMEWSKDDEFYIPLVTYEHKEENESNISQNDLLLLSKEEFKEGAHMPTTYAFALVEQRQKNALRLKMYLVGEIIDTKTNAIESCKRLDNMQKLITSSKSAIEKRLFSLKICSLSTIAREYVALQSISSLPFKDLIITAAEKNSASEDQAWKIPRPLHEHIKECHNESQILAIYAGLSHKSFVLIQGPPGTGKTQTILGFLSALLHATPAALHSKGALCEVKRAPELPIQEKYNHWCRASPWLVGANPRDIIMPVDGDDGFFPSTGNELRPEVVDSVRKYRVRVLVCAPSNSALDEIVFRILQTGILDENVRAYTPKIVRIGLKPHSSIQSVSMDYLVQQKECESGTGKQKRGAAGVDNDSIRAAIADEAVIVCSTLSFSGSALFSKLKRGFDVVIIDEAAQAVETATLVPLANGCKQVFLVGDPVQLPATVISPVAAEFGYGTSLFQRFQRAGYPVHMLKTQYRMHPEIRRFPSEEFYDGDLQDGSDVEQQTKRVWHDYCCFGPFCFFDIHEGKESQPSGSGSLVNVDEVEFVLLMYHKLVSKFPELRSSSQLAIISPYRYQVKLLKERFAETFGVESKQVVDINTVDGFQGREKDVVIFSCVRASKGKSIGFLSDFRRMNVGITRARSSVLVVGSASTLRNDKHWSNLMESAEKKGRLFKVSKPYASFFDDESMENMKVNKEGEQPQHGTEHYDMDIDTVVHSIQGDADQEQPDDNDYGDGDADIEGDFGDE
ncbi:AAA_11 domain-containing protein/AAA_12 domain-containing protein [Cephalotus follicularis]|uniref:AAA_11 domain-containing protein/AAA_12 domain-containing protein n=1 Tax=Cephalotus follicularis TaxID=3775 RepID=A0A1Q3DG92_CEPFO|nr:AAA_11 domain-containing protein/AAA_12 domain-containing protein [Cephalotus follicularis]